MIKLSKIQDIKITDLRADPESALQRIASTKVSLRITSHGKPKGYLVDVEYYDAFLHQLAELERELTSFRK